MLTVVETTRRCGVVDHIFALYTYHSLPRNDGLVKAGNLPLEVRPREDSGLYGCNKRMCSVVVRVRSLGKGNLLRKLCPVVVGKILRVEGRLAHTIYPASHKHQAFTPNCHSLTDLMIAYGHSKEGHVGTSLVPVSTRQRH